MDWSGVKEPSVLPTAVTVVVVHGPERRLPPTRFGFVCLEVCSGLLLDLVGQGMNLEAVEPGHELIGGAFWPVLGVHHEQHVGESSPEVGAVCVVMPG